MYVMSKFFELNKSLEGEIVLDCGCGFGRNGLLFRSFVWAKVDDAYLIGCDIFKEYLIRVKRYNPYDDLVLCDVAYLPFKMGKINHVIASEIIEHLDKNEGRNFLRNITNLCNGTIVLTTPYFPFEQGIIRNNPYEKHVSFWAEDDFKKAGFDTEIEGYMKPFTEVIRRFKLGAQASKIAKFLFNGLVCHLVIFRTAKKVSDGVNNFHQD